MSHENPMAAFVRDLEALPGYAVLGAEGTVQAWKSFGPEAKAELLSFLQTARDAGQPLSDWMVWTQKGLILAQNYKVITTRLGHPMYGA